MIAASRFSQGSHRVDFVCNQYPRISIKAAEWISRAKSGSILRTVTHASQKCPSQWGKLLAAGDNKLSLVKFLLQEWSENEGKYGARLQHRQLLVTFTERCFELSSSDSRYIQKRVVPDLNCNHEEADNRLLLHTAHQANSGYSKVVIRSPYTDVWQF